MILKMATTCEAKLQRLWDHFVLHIHQILSRCEYIGICQYPGLFFCHDPMMILMIVKHVLLLSLPLPLQ